MMQAQRKEGKAQSWTQLSDPFLAPLLLQPECLLLMMQMEASLSEQIKRCTLPCLVNILARPHPVYAIAEVQSRLWSGDAALHPANMSRSRCLNTPVRCLGRVHSASNDDEIHQGPQARVVGVPLHHARQVLHAVQARHGEEDRLALVLHIDTD